MYEKSSHIIQYSFQILNRDKIFYVFMNNTLKNKSWLEYSNLDIWNQKYSIFLM